MSTTTYPAVDPPYHTPIEAKRLEDGPHIHRRISWAAIFGGVILVVAVQLLLGLLGVGIGLGSVNTNGGTTPDASSFGIGAGAWWLVSSIIALGFGGYASAWLAGIEIRWDGVLHGLITWANRDADDRLPAHLRYWRHHWRWLLRGRQHSLGSRKRREGCGSTACPGSRRRARHA